MSRPFDEARYKGLLEGLDTTVLKLSEVRSDNDKFRIDDAYFSKAAVLALRRIESLPHVRLGEVTREFRKGIFDIKADSYVENGIPFVRIADLKNGLIDTTGMAHISPEVHAAEVKTALRLGDIVLSKTAIPAASFVNLDECNVSQDTIAVRLAQVWKEQLRSAFVVAFLNSRYGLALMERQFQGNVQAHLSLPDGKKLSLPLFSLSLQDVVQNAYLLAHEKLQEARKHTTGAEQTLLRALGLENWQPPEPLTYIRRASDAFAAGRLDADYFAPKYDKMIARMAASGECVNLDFLLNVNRRGKQPQYAETGLPVINSKHVLKNEVRLNEDNAFAITSDDALKIENGDVLVNGTGVGTIGRAAAYLYDEPALPDNHVTILRPRSGSIDPIYLSVFLNTIAGQWQVEKYLRGSSGQIELYPTDIAQFKICLAQDSVQQEIHSLVIGAFSARRQAHILLEAAKRAVEIAIEECEAAALAYLKENSELS